MMSATELVAYQRMAPSEQRAKRRELLEINRVADEKWAQALEANRRDVSPGSAAREARTILEALERGDDPLFGYPRECVDFDAAYAALDRACRTSLTRFAAGYSGGISGR